MTGHREAPSNRHRVVQGVTVPSFLYGTAWKEDRTEALTGLALAAGFRGIDTANQRRHYVEAGVGGAVAAAHRQDASLATTCSCRRSSRRWAVRTIGSPTTPPPIRPRRSAQSFESSLEHLRTTYIDSYVLHGPSSRVGSPRRTGRRGGRWRRCSARPRRASSASATCRSEQLVTIHEGSDGQAGVRAEPLLRGDRVGPGHARVLHGSRASSTRASRCLTANPRALRAPAVAGAARRTGRTPAQMRLPVRARGGHAPAHRNLQPGAHGRGSRRVRLRARAGGGEGDRRLRGPRAAVAREGPE